MKKNNLIATVLLLIIGTILFAGCVAKIETPNGTRNESMNETTIVQSLIPDTTHTNYIKMDSEVYNQGEIIEFYLVNEGNETLTCAVTPPSFLIYRQIGNDSWEIPPGVSETLIDRISHLKPGESTRVRRLITTDWTPGLYKIVSDCGVSREFVLRSIQK
jgi:hypothetical protein